MPIQATTYRRLLLESLTLHDRIIELGVRIADLLAEDEQLKAFGKAGLVAVPFRQWRHHLRVIIKTIRLHVAYEWMVDDVRW